MIGTLARASRGELTAAEAWAWSQIRLGSPADFNQYCNTPSLDPKKEEDVRWKAACREVSSHFVENMLTREPQQDAKLSARVRINGARIVENINLENVMLICAIEITDSRIEGAITIRRSHTESVILLDGSLMNEEVKPMVYAPAAICPSPTAQRLKE